jgi:hypothetical protein
VKTTAACEGQASTVVTVAEAGREKGPAANVVSGIVPSAERIALVDGKATVKFMVNGQAAESECGLRVEYGDQRLAGRPDHRRKAGSTLPKEFEHTFTRPAGSRLPRAASL